ncbi:hypothetical protein [Roseimaritima sediminicola]|uniref:hypothetical protein n=1 Tax=Roseimaritima sediminicola TaxID=2662066 RepID=UPI001298435D|nr:hypothetical protein [Roseimaritima sediminicola]
MPTLEQHLSDLFDNDVQAEVLDQQSSDEVTWTLCQVRYRDRQQSSSRAGRIDQTVAFMQADAFDYPQFRLVATDGRGPSRFIMSRLLGAKGIQFPDSPQFAREYLLFGMPEPAVRTMFDSQLREYLAAHPGWSIRANHRQLAIYRERQTCPPEQRDAFLAESLQLLAELSRAETVLDAQPSIERRADASDLANIGSQYGGLVGSAVKRQLKKLVVPREQLTSFLASPVPRRVPATVKRQVLGDTFPLVLVGFAFIVFGIITAVISLVALKDEFRLFMLVPGFVMPLIGAVMAGWTLRHRRRKARMLREGRLETGTVEDVQRTGISVNNRVLHRVTLRFQHRGQWQTATCTVDPTAADKARLLRSDAAPVQILVDPEDDENVFCVDLLITDEI